VFVLTTTLAEQLANALDNESKNNMDSKQQELSEPLINKPLHTAVEHHNVDDDDMILGRGCTMEIAFGDDDDEESVCGCVCGIDIDDNNNDHSFSWCDNLVVWIFLPALVMFQFGMAFVSNNSQGLNSSIVNYSIFSFVLTAALYRRSCQACHMTNTCLILLPEIMLNVILGLLLFNKVKEGYFLLLAGMLFLAVLGIFNTVKLFWCRPKDELEDSFHSGRLRTADTV